MRANQERIEEMASLQALFKNQRGAGPPADQRHSSAVHFLRRIKLVCDAGQRGRVVEREPADRVKGVTLA